MTRGCFCPWSFLTDPAIHRTVIGYCSVEIFNLLRDVVDEERDPDLVRNHNLYNPENLSPQFRFLIGKQLGQFVDRSQCRLVYNILEKHISGHI